jgi:hypothetical protein
LAAIAGRLRAAGDRENLLALRRGLRAGAAPLVPAVKAAAMRQLPRAGGLNRQVAGQRVTVATRLTARSANVRLHTTAPDTRQTNAGYVRHPVFDRGVSRSLLGSKTKWVRQEIPAASGWWSTTLAVKSAEITPVLIGEMRRVAAMVEAG